jgi:hypothetical protein
VRREWDKEDKDGGGGGGDGDGGERDDRMRRCTTAASTAMPDEGQQGRGFLYFFLKTVLL